MSYRIIEGETGIQGSLDWHLYRASRIGASDACSILEMGFNTPYQIWKNKMGLFEVEDNIYMKRGRDLEPFARTAFTQETGIYAPPVVVESLEHPWMFASLDGLSECGKYALEIKCPGAKDHKTALEGKVPEKYIPQLQHQMQVLGLDHIFYYSFDGKNGKLLKVDRDQNFIDAMMPKLIEFYGYMTSLEPPPLTEKDYEEIHDPECLELIDKWKHAKAHLDIYKPLEETLRKGIAKTLGKRSMKGGGVKVSYFQMKGRVQYDKIPELKDVNLDEYRKDKSDSWRFSLDATDTI